MAATSKSATAPALSDPISTDLKQVLRTLKLGKLLTTLPERLTLARQQNLPHADFLELVLADEVTRRDTGNARQRLSSSRTPAPLVAYRRMLGSEQVSSSCRMRPRPLSECAGAFAAFVLPPSRRERRATRTSPATAAAMGQQAAQREDDQMG
jgi:hypothetical protein